MASAPYNGRVKIGGKSDVTVRLPAREAAALVACYEGKIGPWEFRRWAAVLVSRSTFEADYYSPNKAAKLFVEALLSLVERGLAVRSEGRLVLTAPGLSVAQAIKNRFPGGSMDTDTFLKLCKQISERRTGRFAP